MKLSILFFINIVFFIPFLCLANDKPQTCLWINIYDNDKKEQIRTQPIYSGQGDTRYESCQEAIARRKRQVESQKARERKGKQITGGTRKNCYWPSSNNDLPGLKAHQFKLTLKKIGEDQNGEAIYESCTSAQARKQREWINKNFDGHREDAENFIEAENRKLQEKSLSANEKADRAARKQKNVSLLANAGAVAAGIKFAASCSGMGTCNYTWAAISAGLFLAGQKLSNASHKNHNIARQYRGLTDDSTSSSGGGSSGGVTGGPTTTGSGSSSSGGPGVDNGQSTAGIDPGTTGGLPGAQLPDSDPGPKVKIGNNEYNIGSSETEKFLRKKGIKYDPHKKTVTLPDGKTYTEEELNNHPALRNFASSPENAAFKKTMSGIEKQVAAATGDDFEEEEDSTETASLGGGGFSGYSGGGNNGNGDSMGGDIAGGGPGALMAALGKDKKAGIDSNLAGMSVQMGKNRVGVSQDNIFEMIHRRYQDKRKKEHFIEIGK